MSEEIKTNKVFGDELERLELYKQNLWSVTGYEGYTPFSNLYHKVQDELSKTPDGERLYKELSNFGSEVRENLTTFIDDPTDDRLRSFEQYLVTIKSDIQRLIALAGQTQNVEEKTLDKITDNLKKLQNAIDHRRFR